ncbi:Dihydrolipoamide acetyltransferase component of pyruvate dehydrogenase complex [Mycena kentingensis (nom. inval.)]|nr:Dihydrolipoamide acetyltransferase component of pyruvate dehydrogenase complex [Mycena kentingensis (nom. inval.)]
MFLRGVALRRYPVLSLQTRFASRKVLRTFKLADIGEGITECEVIRWSVAPTVKVGAFDPLCEVQSDKASVEITSPYDGVLQEILVEEGKVAKVGQGLCVIEVEEDGSEETAAEPSPPAPTPEPVERADPPQAPTPQPSAPPSRKPHPMDPSFARSSSPSDAVLATPSVRHYARTQGVDLAAVAPGSGKGGRVEKVDVEAFLQGASAAPSASNVVPGDGKEVVVELGRTRAAMWRAMVKSLEVPHFGYSTTLDITELHTLLPILTQHIPAHFRPTVEGDAPFNPAHALGPGVGIPNTPDVPPTGRYTRLTYLPFLLKTLARTMMDWPLLRSSITPSQSESNPKPSLTIRPHADIALALATPTGLYTPVLRAANTHSLYSLASDVAHLAALGRRVPSGLTAAHLGGGGTISVSNVGAAGRGTSAMPVLVPGGGVAIVAVGRAEWVWDVSDEYWGHDEAAGMANGARRLKLPISWSADHRVVEGAELAAFVEAWRGYVENPVRLVGEGL